MKRQSSKVVAERNEAIVGRICEIKLDHPFWGYRKVCAYLRYVDKLEVNRKRILRLMREHALLVKPNLRLKALRTPGRSKPRPVRPNQWWGIDMTKVMVPSFGWVYIVLILDWHTKKLVGYYAGVQCKASHWLEALYMAVNRQFPNGSRDQGLHLMSDNGCQPTSESFMKSCHHLGIAQAFTSYNNPKGNADTERVMRTLKEELIWLKEWGSPLELIEVLQNWVEVDYNENYLHSTLGYIPPAVFERQHQQSHMTLLTTA